jgi:hypothetical protein
MQKSRLGSTGEIRLPRDSSKEEGGGVLKSPETSWTKVIVDSESYYE